LLRRSNFAVQEYRRSIADASPDLPQVPPKSAVSEVNT
jgi:hypothetical protein